MSFESALQATRDRIHQAEHQTGRTAGSVQLVAVSKHFPVEAICAVHALGVTAFGENYVQELVSKSDALAALPIEWHFIGPLQSNKTRLVAERASWVHAIDRLKIAERLSDQRPSNLPDLQVCIQVNVSGEASKSGIEPEQTLEFAQQIATLPHLRLRGLMCIPEPIAQSQTLAAQFAHMQALLAQCQAAGLDMDTLSMGMSADLELAIAHGATYVRVGSGIFGAR